MFQMQADLIPKGELRRLTALLRCLNTEAEIRVTQESRVEPEAVMGTGRFSLEKAARAAGWLKVAHQSHLALLALYLPAMSASPCSSLGQALV